MKKALVLALSAVLALGSTMTVIADTGNGSGVPNGNYEHIIPISAELDGDYDVILPALLPVGRVGEITDYDNGKLTVEFGEYDSIVLHIQPGTVIIDAESGSPASIADRETDRVKIYHSPVVALSFPPQSSALVIALDLPENSFSPNYHIIEAIYWEDEDTLRLTVDNGGLHITLNRETPLRPHLTRQIVLLESISVGDSMLFWYEIVGMSFPGQANPTNAVWVRTGETQTAVDYNEDEEYGESIQPPRLFALPGTGIMRDGIEFFPLRSTIAEVGLTPVWNPANATATTTVGGIDFVLASGYSMFWSNGIAVSLPASVVILNDLMYVPYAFFDSLNAVLNTAQ